MILNLSPLLSRGRDAARALMLDTIRVERPGVPVLDRVTGQLVAPTALLLYDGIGRMKPQPSVGREVEAGEREIALREYVCSLPWDAAPVLSIERGDQAVVVDSLDARMVGLRVTVMSVQYSSTATAWRLGVEDRE